MRIISQNGNVDLPYEKFVFGITKDNKIAYCRECVAPPYEIYNGIIAEYSSKEKALKAMEMLRESYREYIATITTTQGVAQALMFVDNNESNLKLSANIVNGIKENIYFQFPKDDEVEV